MKQEKDQQLIALYREAFPKVAKVIHRLGGDLSTAKDLFHDAMIIYLEKERNNTLNLHTSPSNYITGIAKILWLKKMKADTRNTSLGGLEEHLSIPEDFYPDPSSQTERLLHYLKAAGQKCIQLLQAFYYDKWSMQQIAQEFNYKTKRSATVQKYKCLEKVREQVKHSDVYEEAIA
ncbi:sigma-70 family RNA polymerase sigma factor [Rapidithrix thailandica]|uniref:Sigma-70 family RNA polymerase sigma factor n=1 Tax=Rapidithrix thailandica TaxID=413964 RepID=A0AAW9SEV2_9BACT